MPCTHTQINKENFERRFRSLTGQSYTGQKEAALSLLREVLQKKEIQAIEIKDLIIHLDPHAPEDPRNLLSDRAHWRAYRRAAIQD